MDREKQLNTNIKDVTGSVVLYNNNYNEILRLLNCLIVSNLHKIYVIDNSFSTDLKKTCLHEKITYIHNPTNPGFGSAHNIALEKAITSGAKFHFIINPDIYFDRDVISSMIEYIQNDDLIGMMMPQILNVDGTIQNLPKLLPTPLSIFLRKIKRPKKAYQKFINTYELREIPKELIYNAPILSGCFTLLNMSAIRDVGIYDDRYFMYFEDWDLSRRMHKKYKTIYFPKVSVYHGYDSGANKSLKLFKIFLRSAVAYFNKWGWIFDSERKEINDRALSQFK